MKAEAIESRRRARGGSIALVALLSAGCAGLGSGAAAPGAETPAACSSIDALDDLRASMERPAAFGASSDLYYVVAADDELGYVRLARAEMARTRPRSTEARELEGKLDVMERVLATRRERLGQALTALEATYESAESALDKVATCGDVDMRALAKPARGAEARAAEKELRKKLAAPACEPAVRLWTAVKDVDLTSDVGVSAMAAHVAELSLGGAKQIPLAQRKDGLARALRAHAEALRAFHVEASPRLEDQRNADRALVVARSEVQVALESVGAACSSAMKSSERVVGGAAEPRSVTVTVRPTWSGPLAALPHPEAFGSGFVVRWRDANGGVETRIVTNNHVMDGAFEADIIPGAPDSARSEAPDKLHATLIQANPHDDVAILRLDGTGQARFPEGLSFRLSPAREQEQVVAAGFPGVGVEPSFQVSRGSVSNATFGADRGGANALHALVQHTAPIDPGNSGGPLLDADGNLLGMNTFKIIGRDSVGLAIPTPRIQEALLRAERAQRFDAKNAEGSCNAVVAALASPHPAGEAMSRFGLAVYTWSESLPHPGDLGPYRDGVRGQPATPVDLARLAAYASVRAAVERERGVRPYEVCENLRPGATPGTFVGSFRTRKGKHDLTLAEEHGALRVEAFD